MSKKTEKVKKNRVKIQTSKKLTFVITLVWVLSVATSYFGVLYLDKDTSFILATVSSSFSIVVSGYFAKSFLETKEAEKNKLTELELGLESNNSNQINQDNNLI